MDCGLRSTCLGNPQQQTISFAVAEMSSICLDVETIAAIERLAQTVTSIGFQFSQAMLGGRLTPAHMTLVPSEAVSALHVLNARFNLEANRGQQRYGGLRTHIAIREISDIRAECFAGASRPVRCTQRRPPKHMDATHEMSPRRLPDIACKLNYQWTGSVGYRGRLRKLRGDKLRERSVPTGRTGLDGLRGRTLCYMRHAELNRNCRTPTQLSRIRPCLRRSFTHIARSKDSLLRLTYGRQM